MPCRYHRTGREGVGAVLEGGLPSGGGRDQTGGGAKPHDGRIAVGVEAVRVWVALFTVTVTCRVPTTLLLLLLAGVAVNVTTQLPGARMVRTPAEVTEQPAPVEAYLAVAVVGSNVGACRAGAADPKVAVLELAYPLQAIPTGGAAVMMRNLSVDCQLL